MLGHPGCVRAVNEDVVAYVIPRENDPGAARGALALVADGMGGHAAGDVASRIAAEMVVRLYYEMDGPPVDILAHCLARANRAIYEYSVSDPACAGMGTTCTVLGFRDGAAFLAHIGDSRAYLWRDRKLFQISEDHSLVAELVRRGELTREEAARSPQRHVIVRSLGTAPASEPSIWREGMPLLAGDVFVLCSDGLTDLVDDATIGETIARLAPFDACQALIDAALAAGGTDNISVGVFVVGYDPPPSESRTTRPTPALVSPS
jgi:protein phosphatase